MYPKVWNASMPVLVLWDEPSLNPWRQGPPCAAGGRALTGHLGCQAAPG